MRLLGASHMGKNEEFDWLDDPFDEKKAAREQVRSSTSSGTKMVLGCGCLLAVAGIVVLLVLAGVSMIDLLAA